MARAGRDSESVARETCRDDQTEGFLDLGDNRYQIRRDINRIIRSLRQYAARPLSRASTPFRDGILKEAH
jgi:hypothetical protein